eukprot:1399434-Pyramimonas_sp.AAC.1
MPSRLFQDTLGFAPGGLPRAPAADDSSPAATSTARRPPRTVGVNRGLSRTPSREGPSLAAS